MFEIHQIAVCQEESCSFSTNLSWLDTYWNWHTVRWCGKQAFSGNEHGIIKNIANEAIHSKVYLVDKKNLYLRDFFLFALYFRSFLFFNNVDFWKPKSGVQLDFSKRVESRKLSIWTYCGICKRRLNYNRNITDEGYAGRVYAAAMFYWEVLGAKPFQKFNTLWY